MALMESGEMYLENILILSKELPAVRSIDIADRMEYSKPSVSRAVGILKDSGYIDVDTSGHIKLTDTGRELAEKIYDRHNTLTRALMLMGIDKETAQEDACRIEHYISDKSFNTIKEHLKNVKK